MIRIYRSTNNGEFIIQTDALNIEAFLDELSLGILRTLSQFEGDDEHVLLSILSNAIPLCFKIKGYKAESVHSRRVLTSGYASPDDSDTSLVIDIGAISPREANPIDLSTEDAAGIISATTNGNDESHRKEPKW